MRNIWNNDGPERLPFHPAACQRCARVVIVVEVDPHSGVNVAWRWRREGSGERAVIRHLKNSSFVPTERNSNRCRRPSSRFKCHRRRPREREGGGRRVHSWLRLRPEDYDSASFPRRKWQKVDPVPLFILNQCLLAACLSKQAESSAP